MYTPRDPHGLQGAGGEGAGEGGGGRGRERGRTSSSKNNAHRLTLLPLISQTHKFLTALVLILGTLWYILHAQCYLDDVPVSVHRGVEQEALDHLTRWVHDKQLRLLQATDDEEVLV